MFKNLLTDKKELLIFRKGGKDGKESCAWSI